MPARGDRPASPLSLAGRSPDRSGDGDSPPPSMVSLAEMGKLAEAGSPGRRPRAGPAAKVAAKPIFSIGGELFAWDCQWSGSRAARSCDRASRAPDPLGRQRLGPPRARAPRRTCAPGAADPDRGQRGPRARQGGRRPRGELDAFIGAPRCPWRAHDDAALRPATPRTAAAGSPRCARSRTSAASSTCRWAPPRTTGGGGGHEDRETVSGWKIVGVGGDDAAAECYRGGPASIATEVRRAAGC